MNKITLVVAISLLLITMVLRAQSPIRIQVVVARPYPNSLHMFQSNPSQVVIYLTNNQQSTLDVQLIGNIISDNGMGVRTRKNYRAAKPVTLMPLSTRPLTAEEIGQLFDVNNLDFVGIDRGTAIRLNGLPPGDYQVCIQALDYRTLTPLSESEPLGCSNIFPVSELEPPVIIKPFPDDSIQVQSPQNIVFSWSLPPGAPPATQYFIRIVEVPPGRNPFDVMRATRQPFYETTVTGAPTILYGPAEPILVPGRQYAMMVTASDPFNNLVFRNGGKSEVIAFTYGRHEKTSTILTSRKNESLPDGNIPRSVIVGKINWYFQATEEKSSSDNYSYTVKDYSSVPLIASVQDPSAGPFSKSTLTSALDGGVLKDETSTASPKQSIVPSASAILNSIGAGVIVHGGGNPVTVQAFEQYVFKPDAERLSTLLSKAGSVGRPLQKASLKIYAIKGRSKTLLASGTTDDEGAFQIPFVNVAFYNESLGDKIMVHVDQPDFILENSTFTLSTPDAAGRHDVGDLTAIARTFRITPKVVDEDNKEITTASISIYRPADYYDRHPNHRFEGSRRESDSTYTFNGRPYHKVGTVKHAQTLYRLFYSDDWTENYMVRVDDRVLNPLSTTLGVTGFGGIQDNVQNITRTYRCTSRLPALSGVVVKKLQPEVAASGAVITFYYNEDADFGTAKKNNIQKTAESMVGSLDLKSYSTQVSANFVSPSNTGIKTISNNPNLLAPTAQTTNNSQSHFSPGAQTSSLAATYLMAKSVSTTADEDGKFSFTDLPTSKHPVRIEISLPGHQKVYPANRTEILNRGDHPHIKIALEMTVFTVTGALRDEENTHIPGAELRWASGGDPFPVDHAGRFIAKNTAGTDTLIITKIGYQKRKLPVTLTEPKPKSKNDNQTPGQFTTHLNQEAWAAQILSLPSFQPSQSSAVAAFSASGLGYHTIHAIPTDNKPPSNSAPGPMLSDKAMTLAPLYSAMFSEDERIAPAVDLDTIVLKKRIGRILVQVISTADSTAIAGAIVQVLDTSVSGTTGQDGTWYSEVPGGEVIVQVTPPAGSGLVAAQRQRWTSDVNVTRIVIALDQGVSVTGVVNSEGQTIDGASIAVEGFDYLNTVSDEKGAYSLIIPKGQFTLKATKIGYEGAQVLQDFQTQTAQVNFVLTKPNFDISRLLGFEIEVEKITGEGTRRRISGAIVNIPANTAFKAKPGTKLPFDEVEVDIVNNIPVPRGGQLPLSLTTMELLAFDYLPVSIKNQEKALVIRQIPGNVNSGRLTATAQINYAKFIPIPLGLEFPENSKHILSSPTVGTELEIISSGTSQQPVDNFKLSLSTVNAKVYGFDVNLNKTECIVKSDGLYFHGDISLASLPLLGNSSIALSELVVGKDATIKRATLSLTGADNISLASWSASLLSASLNENGIQLSGNVKLKVPQSSESAVGFDNLTVSTTSLYGGTFSLPEDGLDIFGIVKMKRGHTPLSFGRLGNSSVHYLGGSGEFKLPKFIDKNVNVDFFQLQTDGKFAAQVPVNFKVPFLGIASIAVRNIEFRTIGRPGIDVMGDFNLHGIPFFSACAGGIRYGSNGQISFDELGIGFDLVGVARLNAKAKFIDQVGRQGFEGTGSIRIKATPVDLDLGFRYYKLPNGIEVGARLRAGVVLPVGFVTISKIEGEFGINTQEKKWMGRLGGSVSVGGLNEMVAIDPLSITVESGPVFKLEGSMSVVGQRVAKAQGLLDFPKSYFSFDFRQDINFLPELYTVSGGGRVVLSTADNDRYWMMGARYHSSMLGGLVEGNANITAGWGMNVGGHPEHHEYTNFINPAFLKDGKLAGIHVKTSASIDFDTGERGWAGVATGRAWYYNYGQVSMDMGFGSGQYGFRVAAGWGGGAWLKIMDWQVGGVDVGIDGELNGHYNYGQRHLYLGGSLYGRLAAHINCAGECSSKICWGACVDACDLIGEDCEVCPVPVGGRICLKGGIHASYDSHAGLDIGLDF